MLRVLPTDKGLVVCNSSDLKPLDMPDGLINRPKGKWTYEVPSGKGLNHPMKINKFEDFFLPLFNNAHEYIYHQIGKSMYV